MVRLARCQARPRDPIRGAIATSSGPVRARPPHGAAAGDSLLRVRLRAPTLLAGGALLLAVLVSGYGAFAWITTERRVLEAAEAEGRALLSAVAAGVETSLRASQAVDRLLGERLLELAEDLEGELASRPARAQTTLAAFVKAHGLRGAALLDGDLATVAAVDEGRLARPLASVRGPFDAPRIDRINDQGLAERARQAGLAGRDRLVLGFGESGLGRRTEFVVGLRAPRAGGYLVLRREATELRSFEESAGLQELLHDAAATPAIAHLLLQDRDGRVLAADDPARVGEINPPAEEGTAWRPDGRGGRVLDVAVATRWPGSEGGHLVVGLAAGPVEELLHRSRRDVLIFTLAALLAGAGGLGVLAWREAINRRREEALRGDLEARERFASLGRLAGGVAHEIRGPLNALSMASQRIQREMRAQEPARDHLVELTATVREEVARLDRTVEEFLCMGRRDAPRKRVPVALGELVREVASAEGVDAQLVPPAQAVVVACDRDLLGRALGNLVRNAAQAAPDTPVRIRWRQSGDDAVVEVTDQGAGIPAEGRARIFEPFFTGRVGGTGLGLTIARDAVERHGGTLEVCDGTAGGTTFAIRIPLGGRP